MASDIKLNENAVVVEGNIGVGTSSPIRMLHVEGSEIHSGGPAGGFSFADRTKGNAERWVWYAQDGKARLWSQKHGVDVLTLTRQQDNSWAIALEGKVFVDDDLFVHGTLRGTARIGVQTLLGREMGPKRVFAIQCEANALQLAPNASDSNPRFALVHDLHVGQGKDALVINQEGAYKQGVRIESNVQVNGVLTQASSIALKENVAQLSSQEAMAALQGLSTVKFTYKADEQKEQHVGFIAEDVPDLVAKGGREAVSPMDIVGVLTKVVQEQQKMLANLTAEVNTLKQQQGGE